MFLGNRFRFISCFCSFGSKVYNKYQVGKDYHIKIFDSSVLLYLVRITRVGSSMPTVQSTHRIGGVHVQTSPAPTSTYRKIDHHPIQVQFILYANSRNLHQEMSRYTFANTNKIFFQGTYYFLFKIISNGQNKREENFLEKYLY